MSLYDTGTVTIANGANIITGTGTNWVAVAGVKVGDLITVDGSLFLQIYAVNSDTELLVKTIPDGLPYAGTTLTDVKYAIVRHFTDSTNAEIAASVMALQQKWHIRENEMTGWYASTDATYPVTSLTGDTYNAVTPFGVTALYSETQAAADLINDVPVHAQQVSDDKDLVFSYLTTAEDVEITTGVYSLVHYSAKSIDAKDAAVAAQGLSEGARDLSQEYASHPHNVTIPVVGGYSSLHYKTEAETAEGNAVTAQGLSEDARDLAQNYANYAHNTTIPIVGGYSSLHYNTEAQNAKTAAETARDKAAEWADKPTEVETGRYSAKYWADQAEAITDTGSYVLNTRTINGYDLSADRVLNAADVGALPANQPFTYQNAEGRFRTPDNTTFESATSIINGLQIYQDILDKDAMMTFHVGADYAVHFGLSGLTNKLSVGGYSMGANSYAIYHEGNKNTQAYTVSSATTIFETAPVLEICRVANTTFQTDLAGTWTPNTVITLNKGLETGAWTVLTQSGTFIYPDGTASDTTLTFPSGFTGSIKLMRRNDNNWEVYPI